MNNQDQVPTIAELWGEFQRLHARFLRLYAGTMPDNVHPDAYMRGKDDLKHKVQYLRQQLIDRLDLINVNTPSTKHAYMLFGFTGANDEAISFIPRNDHDGEFMPTIEQCNELSAMFAFCGWELEQREKEKKG